MSTLSPYPSPLIPVLGTCSNWVWVTHNLQHFCDGTFSDFSCPTRISTQFHSELDFLCLSALVSKAGYGMTCPINVNVMSEREIDPFVSPPLLSFSFLSFPCPPPIPFPPVYPLYSLWSLFPFPSPILVPIFSYYYFCALCTTVAPLLYKIFCFLYTA